MFENLLRDFKFAQQKRRHRNKIMNEPVTPGFDGKHHRYCKCVDCRVEKGVI